MRALSVLLLSCCSLLAADKDFNGRWDITVPGEARNRAWWLEVNGAGTASPTGSFVGAPGGQLDPITDLKIINGVLQFHFERAYRMKGDDPKQKRVATYEARLVDGKLAGTQKVDGHSDVTKWTGVRAPEIPEKDGPQWKEGKPVELFNGKNLSNWSGTDGKPPVGWTVADGLLKNSKEAKDIISHDKFWNFKMHVEYKVAHHSNSGIGLRNRYEIQIFGDHGEQTSVHGNGALYSRIVPAVNATLPPDEWQTLDVRLVGRVLTVVMNGKTLIDHKHVDGLTAVATDPNEAEPGAMSLQGDHGPVQVRKFTITPLTK